jgi:UDP-glucose 4-epimerase
MICVVTGGAGFIGSHLVDRLLSMGHEVTVIDNLSGGRLEFIEGHFPDDRFNLIKKDISADGLIKDLKGADIVYHLAANPDVKLGAENTKVHMRQNIIATYNVLDSMRELGVKNIAFTSTSTVYGEAAVVPTPENYGPLMPISLYGASKLSCEALISAYCHTFGMTSWLYRFANIIGDRSTHGVIYDFILKLNNDPAKLTILGDGRQSKSYLHVRDCVNAMLFAVEKGNEPVNIFNIGSEDRIDVTAIAGIIIDEMGLNGVQLEYTGGMRGWAGDVPFMGLSIERMKALGWKPEHNSEESVRMCVRSLLGKKA